MLKGVLVNKLTEILYEGCKMNKWWIEELAIKPDHIHMLIQIKPRESIAEVMQKIKGVSSRRIRLEYPDLEEYEWGDSLWCDGYFAITVGEVDEKVIKKYISEQRN